MDLHNPLRIRWILRAYWLSLIIPLALILDSLLVWMKGQAGLTERVAVLLCLVWLVAGLAALKLTRDRARFCANLSKPLLSLFTVLFVIGAVEGLLRLTQKTPRISTLYPSDKRWFVQSDPTALPGVSPTVRFSTDNVGLRGPDMPLDSSTYRIVTVGGSTTECWVLDDSEEWPHLLMERLNTRQKRVRVWVGNAGVSGLSTVHHLDFLKRFPILSRVNLLLFLVGANDLSATLALEGKSTQSMLETDAAAFPLGLDPTGAHFRRLYLFTIFRNGLLGLTRYSTGRGVRSDQFRSDYVPTHRQLRASHPIVPLPELRRGLEEYAQRIRNLERECVDRSLRCVFLTQPSMVRPGLPTSEQRLLWFAWVGPIDKPKGYLSLTDEAHAIDLYNQTLLDVCRRDELECYDLASQVPRDASAFYDDYHFNRGGARIVADYLARQLMASLPFTNSHAP